MDGKFTLEIEMGNAEMRTRTHVRAALRELSARLRTISFAKTADGKIMDANGNTVGRWEYKREG